MAMVRGLDMGVFLALVFAGFGDGHVGDCVLEYQEDCK